MTQHCYSMTRTLGAKRNPSFFEEPKSLEVVVHLNFSSWPRVKELDNTNAQSVIKNMAQQSLFR